MEVRKIPKKTVTVIQPARSNIVDKSRHQQLRVAAYCRVSTDNEEQLTSYENQKKVYTEMIASRTDWTLAGIYADEGISGTQVKKRKNFKKMIDQCLAGKIDYIVTKSVSRFARNTVECLEYVRMLKARGIGIFFEEQNIDTLKSDSELYLVIYAGFAQSESESISKNITWSIRKKYEEGIPTFSYRNWLGYRKGADGEPEIIPEEAAVVRRIFELYLSGNPQQVISDMLRAENLQFPGKTFSFSKGMIQNILTNERYCGDCILQKTVTVDCIGKVRRKNMGEAPMYYVQNSHAPIITRETFNRVQEEMARRKTKAPTSAKNAITASGKYSKYALSEVLICGECGTRYRRRIWSKNGKKKAVWRCCNRIDYGTQHCKRSPTVEETEIHNAIVRALKQFNEQDRPTYMNLMRVTLADALGLNESTEETASLQSMIDGLNRKMIEIVNESVQTGTDIACYEDQLRGISEKIESLKQQIEIIRQKTVPTQDQDCRVARMQQIIESREENTEVYDDSTVRQMVECIKVYHDGRLEIIFGCGITIEERVMITNIKNKQTKGKTA